jgi:predicted short-subunit dehydrogenase-like oxidoreductase (DUF2520 family)
VDTDQVTRAGIGDGVAERIGFIGAGRLATGLAWALAERGGPINAVASASGTTAHRLASRIPACRVLRTPQEVVDAVDLVFVAVPDDAIPEIAASLRWRSGMAVVHCSGATEVATLEPAARQGAQIGGFHPLQSFGDPDVAVKTLPGCAIAIEADEPLLGRLETLAAVLGCRPIRLPAGSRARYHAAAHYAAGFVFALIKEAADVWQTFGIAREDTVAALLPLLRGTAASMEHSGLVQGLPGIFSRGDIGTLRKHLVDLEAAGPDALRLYCELGLRSIPLGLERGGLSPERAAEMRALLLHTLRRCAPQSEPTSSQPRASRDGP